MEKAPYTPSPKNVKEFFKAIKSLGTPPKVNNSYLPTIGFKSSNDRYLVGVSKFLGFIDNANVPTQKWDAFRDKNKAESVMASAIKTAYDDLFATYHNAESKDDETLRNYFAPKFKVADVVAKRMVQTFKNLCEFADFKAVQVEETATTPAALKEAAKIPSGVRPITININIQLSLPATEDATIYESLFSALKKHLFS